MANFWSNDPVVGGAPSSAPASDVQNSGAFTNNEQGQKMNTTPTAAKKTAENIPYLDTFKSASGKYGVPLPLLLGLAQQESNFNPKAVNNKSGAEGMMQVIPKWHPDLTDPYNPEQAIPYAAKLLAKNYEHFGNWSDAVQAYHDGVKGLTDIKSGLTQQSQESALYGPGVLAKAKTFDGILNKPAPEGKFWANDPIAAKAAEFKKIAKGQGQVDFWDEFKSNLQNPITNIAHNNILVHIAQGFKRIADGKGSWMQNTVDELNKDLKSVHKDWKGMSMAKFKLALQTHPGAVAAGFINSLIADPEMILVPGGFGGKLAEAAGDSAVKLGQTASKIAYVGTRAAESGAIGAGMGASITQAQQFATGQYSASDVASSAEFAGLVGTFLGIRGKSLIPKEVGKATPEIIDALASKNPETARQWIETLANTGRDNLENQVAKSKYYSFSTIKDINKAPTDKLDHESQMAYEALRTQHAQAKAPADRTLEDLLYLRAHNLKADPTVHVDVQAGGGARPKESSLPVLEKGPIADHLSNPPQFARKDNIDMGSWLPKNQRGMAQTDILKWLGIPVAGAVAGATLDPNHPVGGAIIGGIGSAAALALPSSLRGFTKFMNQYRLHAPIGGLALGAYEDDKHPVEGALVGMALGIGIRALPKVEDRYNVIDHLINERLGALRTYSRHMWQLQTSIRDMVPDIKRREQVSMWIDGGGEQSGIKLNADERKVADAVINMNQSLGKDAVDQGVLKELRDNYISHIVEWGTNDPAEVDRLKQMVHTKLQFAGAGRFRTTSGFAKARSHETFQDLHEALAGTGLRIKTMDVADIAAIYGRSMKAAIENRRLLNQLKEIEDAHGRPLITSAEKAPQGYKFIDHPSMMTLRVHPDIAPSLKFVMQHVEPNTITKGLYTASVGLKRLAISANLFHAKSLLDSYIGAGGYKAGITKTIPKVLDELKKGGAGDTTDILIHNGLTVQLPEDVNPEAINSAAKKIGHYIDSKTGLTLGDKAANKVNAFNEAINTSNVTVLTY